MKKAILISAIFATIAFAITYPIVAEFKNTTRSTALPDSVLATVICKGEMLIPWTPMGTIGRYAYLECTLPDTILFAVAIISAFWGDSLRDTTAFTISLCGNPLLSSIVMDSVLSERHGDGSWRSSLALPFLLTMSEEDFIATFGGTSNAPISVFRGDFKRIDFLVLDAKGDTIDLTDALPVFTARRGESDTDFVVLDTLSIIDPNRGLMRLELSSQQTSINPKSYAGDIELSFPDGRVFTVWRSRFIVKWDVSR